MTGISKQKLCFVNRTCGCCALHFLYIDHYIISTDDPRTDGIWWDCHCTSTMYYNFNISKKSKKGA